MIYVHRDWDTVPQEVKAALRQAAVELEALADVDQRKAYINANRDKWAAVRAYLSGMSHGKCWYSEAREAVSRYQVDHFRPHGRSKQAAKQYSEGYSWLAFDIENFRLAGVLCNTVNQEFSEDSVGKGDWFPLADPARRATLQNRDTGQETPVLLDPTNPDDPYKLWFDEDGNVAPDPEMLPDQKAAVEEAITCLGLRQSRLNERRRAVLRRAARAAVRFKDTSRVPAGARTVRDMTNLNEARAELLAMSASKGEFAAAVRCLLVAYGLRQLVSTDELAPLAMAPDHV
ncbi:MAG: hypothetical protein ACTHOH_11675 [Lysobacteraceae bacterium]